MNPTPRDREILHALNRVRYFSLEQIARIWWPEVSDPVSGARSSLSELTRAGLTTLFRVQTRRELDPSVPLATWQPGLPSPSARELTRITKSRFRDVPVVQFVGVIVRGGRPPKETEATHDLHLAAVYLRMRAELPTRAQSWVFETDIQPWEGYHPDAIVRDGRSLTVIEFAGEYDEAEIARCHRACESRNHGYEIW